MAGGAFLPSPLSRCFPLTFGCHARRCLAYRCVCQSVSSSPSSGAHARCPRNERPPRPRHRRQNSRARRVALAPVAELSVVFAACLVDDHVVGDVLLAGRFHQLFHQGVRSHLQASRVGERLDPTCRGSFHVLDVLGGQRFVCSCLPLACVHFVEVGFNV